MKKKKLLLPLAVMTLSCGLAAGVLTGCGGHKHNFTEWDYDDSGHWQICVEDGEKSEKKNHEFGPDNKCECGAEKPKYGTASGQVKLWRMGKFVTDFAGVTLDTGEDDGIEIDFDPTTGGFEITNARVGKSYTLTISKTGYLSYSTTLEVVENENSVIGGSTGCVLNYDMFDVAISAWGSGNAGAHDFSKVNDEHAQIGCNKDTLNVLTKEAFLDISTSITIKEANSTHGWHAQGIWMKFEDGKSLILRAAMFDKQYRLTFVTDQWGSEGGAKSWLENEINFHYFDADQQAAMKSEEGIEVQLVRKGGRACVYLADELVYVYDLPEEYATQKAQTGFWDFDSAENAVWNFEITETLPVHASTVTLTQNVPEDAEGVKIALDKETYSLGDDVTLTVTLPEEGYIVSALTLNGESVLSRLQEGKLTFVAMQEENKLVVTVIERRYADVEVAVTGKKYDVKSGSSIADDTTVTLKRQGSSEDVTFTVTGGKISKENVVQGTYTAQVAGYKPVDVVVGENGITTPIVFEYDGFTMLPPNYDVDLHDFSQINDGIIKVNGSNDPGKSMDIVTKDSYGDVSVTINVKNSVGGVVQGIVLKFDDNKYVMFNFKVDQKLVQYRPEMWKMNSVFGNTWIEHAVSDSDIENYNSASGVDLQLVRKGDVLYEFVDGRYVGQAVLPEGYATKKAQVGFFSFDPKVNASWNFTITENLPSITSTVELTEHVPQGVDDIEIALDKTTCTLGDTVTLTVTLPEDGYVVSDITVNGKFVLDQLSAEGKITFTAMQAQNTVEVTVVEKRYANVTNVAVTGKKYDVKNGSSITDGTTVTLKGLGGLEDVVFTVADGKISKENVVQGTYTAYVERYKPLANVVVGANGIETPIVFEYADAFNSYLSDWDHASHSYSHVNDEVSYIDFSTGGTFNPVTKDSYSEVAATLRVDWNNSTNNMHTQGIVLIFANGKHAIVRYHNGDGNGNIQYAHEAWNYKKDASVFKDSGLLNQWGEYAVHQLSNAERAAITNGNNPGLELTVVLKGGKLYVFFDGKFVTSYELPEDVQDQNVKIGYFAFNPKQNTKFYFDISTDLPTLTSTVAIEQNVPQDETGFEITLDKTAYMLGDVVTLNVTSPEEGYVISALTLDGKSILNQLSDGTFTFTAMKTNYAFAVTVIAKTTTASVDVAVMGKKYDVKNGSSIADGTTVTLKGLGGLEDETLTVTDGRITKTITQGTYIAQVAGYKSVEVFVGASGIETEIVFEYDGFDFVKGWDTAEHDFSKVNEEQSQIGCDGKTLNVITKQSYDDVSVSLWVKDDNSRNGNDVQGIWLKFDDGKYMMLRSATYDNQYRLTYIKDTWELNSWLSEEINFNFFNEAQTTAIKSENGIKMQIVRQGGKLYTFLGDVLVHTYDLPEGYENSKVQVGFWAFDSAANAVWDFEITDTLPEIPEVTEN